MSLNKRFRLLKEHARRFCPAPLKHPGCTLIFSVSDGDRRALALHAAAASFEKAWRQGYQRIRDGMDQEKLHGRQLRVDWVESYSRLAWGEFQRRVASVRRAYFRFGFALDENHTRLLTEMECNANAIFYGGPTEAAGRFNEKNFAVYAARRFNGDVALPSSPEEVVWIVATAGVYQEQDATPVFIPGPLPEPLNLMTRGLYAGHREIARLTPESLKRIVASASRWLASQIQPDGKFIYGYFPCFDRKISAYNSLRHASSLYSLLDVAKFTQDASLLGPVAGSLAFLAREYIRVHKTASGKQMAFLAESDTGEIKLGGNGVALLAFSRYRECTGSGEYDELMTLLAEGIAFMQNPDTGAFAHVLHGESLAVKEDFRIIYYDGEAVFGLLRLYQQDRNPRWLSLAGRAFGHFLSSGKHREAHDHWLSYASNEMAAITGDERYVAFCIANCMPRLNFILNRETAYPTLLELMMAAQNMFLRLGRTGSPYLPGAADMDRFRRALHYRAHYLLNGYFWPEMAMFYKNPDCIANSFFIRHHAFRARIDDVQHFLSGLAAYGNMLAAGDPFWAAPEDARSLGGRFQMRKAPRATPAITTVHEEKAMTDKSLRVGVLRLNKTGFWHPQSTMYAMFYAARQFNIELFLFGPDDIDFETETVHAMFLEQNEKIYKDVPLPLIVDNPILGGKYAPILEQLEKNCILVRHSLNTTKLRTYNRLLEEGTYRHILIPTYLLDDTEKIDAYLDLFGNSAVMKPLRGARGIGIVKVARERTQYAATYNNQTVSYTHREFDAFARKFLMRKNYIIQPFIRSRTKQGNPFDIRIHTRRGALGKFQIHLFPRIGNSAGIVSNISSGGFSMNTEAFLKLEFGNLWKKIYNDLMELGNNFPEYYQKFYDVPIFDIGMDMGIVAPDDKSYELKMYEVNTYIDGPFFEIEDAITHFEYYRYLSAQPRPNVQGGG